MENKYRQLVIIFILLLVVSLSGITKAASKTVEVKGLAHIENNNLADAKERALNRGLRRAVEQVVGTYIDAETKVKNGQLITDEIIKDSRGYVKDYQILQEQTIDGNYQVQLRVEVGTEDLMNDLEALKMNIKRSGNPRVMILVSQVKEGHYVNLSPQVVGNKLMTEFIDAGYHVLDKEQIKKAINNEQRQAIIGGDYDLASKLGTKLQVDLIIIGDARASHVDLSDVYDGNLDDFESYSSNINAKIVNTNTAEVITTANADANGAGANKESAARKALTKAAGMLGRELVGDLSNKLIQAEKTINIKVNNLHSIGQLKELETTLGNLREISRVYLRNYSNELGTFDVDLKQGVRTLDIAVQLEDRVDFDFEIKNLSPAKLVLEIK